MNSLRHPQNEDRSAEAVLTSLEGAVAARTSSPSMFFKTGEGQYSHGDIFLGVKVPDQRKIAAKYKGLPLLEIKKLLQNPIHECRSTALFILVHQYKNADPKTRKEICTFYIKNLSCVNNWDLVDSSAHKILGTDLIGKQDRKILYRLAKSKSHWERRIAIISTFAFIDIDDFDDAIAIAKIYLTDDEDLIHKATGWVLREVGKKSKPTLIAFLDEYAQQMPRTALRYAIEHLNATTRKKYMQR